MKVYEFHFNPKLRPDLIFDTFCYEPENIYEKRIGSLYMAGLLKNVLPQNLQFLNKLAKIIQKEYYRPISRKPEKALKESLKLANEFLEKEAKKGDVSWLGNLSFLVLSLKPPTAFGQKGWEINFSKVGDIKIFLLRGEKIIDLDQKVKLEEVMPWPLKIFGSIVSGKLIEDDTVFILSKEIADFLERENLLSEFEKIWPVNEKKLKEIFDKEEEEVLKISGLCLTIVLSKEQPSEAKQIISPEAYIKKFNLREAFIPIFAFFKKIGLSFFSWLKLPEFFKWSKIQLPKFRLPKLNKQFILILTLILCLVFGFFISQLQEESKSPNHQTVLENIPETINQNEVILTLNKLEVVKEPKLLFDFSADYQDFTLKFLPQTMVFFKEDFYFFNPSSPEIFKLTKDGKGQIIEVNQNLALAAKNNNLILFFAKPNQIFALEPGGLKKSQLELPESDFDFKALALFNNNLYFLDQKNGKIIKYPYLENLNWGFPQPWLVNEEKLTEAKSMTIDGSIWILGQNNSLFRYRLGQFQEEIKLEIQPEIKELKKIFTSSALSYLYISEPAQKRIIIIDKKGAIIKQFQSEKFDNLLDFSVSEDGKIIFLLNGPKVYQLNL